MLQSAYSAISAPLSCQTPTLSRLSRLALVAALLLFIQGCKLIVTSPPLGGYIESRTGNNDCPAGTTCVIDVPGIPFSDTFTAVPDPGYVFVGWKDAPDHVCKGSKDPCELENLPAHITAEDIDLNLEAVFEVDILGLLPQSTRGLIQIHPGRSGALNTGMAMADWSRGPLQLLKSYSVGLNIESVASSMTLAQLDTAPDELILLSVLEDTDVDSLSAGLTLVPAGTHQGYPLFAISGTDLHFVKIDTYTMAIAPLAVLQLSLDVYAGVVPSIESGPFAAYLTGLTLGEANTVIYALPALYGPVPAPGDGTTSVSQADAVSSSFAVESDVLSGGLAFYSDNAATYIDELKDQLMGLPSLPMGSIGDVALFSLDGLSASEDVLPLLKTLVQDMDAVDYADAVIHGGNVPWLNFAVSGDPAAIFINFEFEGPTEIAAFEAAHLPPGFTLVPHRMMESDPLKYLMVLNIYQSSGGLVEGARAEWSVFVNDPVTGAPRFMVVEAKAENLTVDSVNLVTTGEPVSYELDMGFLESYVGVEDPNMVETTYFSASIPWPQPPSTHEPFAREFMPANDYVFWGNAVADRVLYNNTAVNRDGAVVPAGQFTVTDNSSWDPFLKDDPVHAVVYLNNQEIVISPWWNLDESYLDVTPAYRQTLIDFKNNFYPMTAQNLANDAIRGVGVALTSTKVSASGPSVHYHFPLLDAAGLLTAVAPGAGYTPMAVDLFEGESAATYLTLSVYSREDDPCGMRAEWTTYIVGANGRPESLQLDAVSSEGCLDPMSFLTVAAEVTQDVIGTTLDTQVNSRFINFDATVDLSVTSSELVGLNWLEATERICSLNDICDEFYYDGQRVVVPADHADTLATQVVTVDTPWNAYIDTGAARATVRQNESLEVFNAWRNLRPFAAEAPVP